MRAPQPAEEAVPDVSERVSGTLEASFDRLQDLVSYLPLLAVALGVVALFAVLAHLAGRWRAPYARLRLNPFATDLVRQGVRLATFLVGVLIALDLLEATALVGAVLGTAGVLGIAVGFAFRDLVENYISSILLSVRQPFAPDDHVVVDGQEGKVIRLTSRATILMTLDGNHLRIPNSQVFKGVILNYSRNPLRRFRFGVDLGVKEDLREAQRLAVEAMSGVPGVLADPQPQVLIEGLGDSSVKLQMFGWVDQREASFAKVRGEAIRRVKTALEDAGMDLPEPTYRLQMLPGAVEAPQPERPRPEVAAAAEETPEAFAAADTAPETALERQIAADRAAESSTDLLRSDGPQE